MAITRRSFLGWDEVVLSDGRISAHVLPGKGADIRAIVDLDSGVNLLFEAPWGLQPPGSPPREGWMGEPFLANYEGGWQELLPNTNDRCVVDGVEFPFHGEVAALPWTWELVEDGGLELRVDCRLVSLRLRRRMTLTGDRALVLEEEVSNTGGRPVRFTWGHHLVLGAPLLDAGSSFDVPAGVVKTPAEPWEGTHRLSAGQLSRWPLARARDGREIDLREIPGPEAGSHDDVFIGELRAGWAEVVNPALGLGVRLEWDAGLFAAVVSWQAFGGAIELPLAGSYALGVEPWATDGNAADAVATGRALSLAPGESVSTQLRFSIFRPRGEPVRRR